MRAPLPRGGGSARLRCTQTRPASGACGGRLRALWQAHAHARHRGWQSVDSSFGRRGACCARVYVAARWLLWASRQKRRSLTAVSCKQQPRASYQAAARAARGARGHAGAQTGRAR
eukprot:scaffold3852_cov402-Prasinococcus_capsulatus_cf.AAC.21